MVPLASEKIFEVAGFPITNTLLNTWIAVAFFVIVAFLLKGKIQDVPRGLQNFFESVIEWLMGYFDQVTHSRKKSYQFLPIVGALFLFILFSNWISLVPGTGSIGIYQKVGNEVELVPMFRPAASDINTTLALAVFALVAAHLMGIKKDGFYKHLNKFIKIDSVIGSFKKGIVGVMVALVDFGVGLIEVVGELAKVLSLSLRLFGNIFAGEVLLTVIAGLVAFGAPLPFMGLELLVGLIQASIFSILTLVYLTSLTAEHGGH